ncbi:MAG: hypothetical protein K8R89_04925, partial [Anaerolineae bacterium]|nr:hypothetical protein [Anaerolineae bacterium]
RYWRLWLLMVLALVLWGRTAYEVTAQEGVTYDPAQLNFAATRGSAASSRSLLIRATAPITELQVIPRDLLDGDETIVLPPRSLRAPLVQHEIAAGELLTIPVTLDFQDLPSGRFTGSLLITYHSGELTVPVTVAVKDPPLIPLLFLVAGVAAGFGVSLYRAQGRPRDQVLVRVGQVRNPMAADKQLQERGKPFYERLEAELYDVQVTLQAQDWSAAKAAIKEAEGIWNLWERERRNWLRQIGAYDELQHELETLPASIYRKSLEQEAREAYLTMPDRTGPEAFKVELAGVAQRLYDFSELAAQIDGLADEAHFRQRLYALDAAPENAQYQEQYKALASEVATAQEAARTTARQPEEDVLRGGEGLAFGIPKGPGGEAPTGVLAALFKLPRLLGSRPAATSMASNAKQAVGRLQLFTWLTYLVAVGMLAAAGFNELYTGVPTFGATGWGDYFTLLAWGFGAEATRASITSLLKTWELPTTAGGTVE